MSIYGIGHGYDQNTAIAAKSKKNANSTQNAALDKTDGMQELTEAKEMEMFKKEFYEELKRIPINSTIINLGVNISEEAFKNMKADPEYREKILSVLRRDLTASFAPTEVSLLITVGATAEDYRGDSWGVNNDSEFFARSQNSFYKKTGKKKDRQKELLEEYMKKQIQAKKQRQKALNKKLAERAQERSRMAEAFNAYEAHVMVDADVDNSALFG